MIMNERLKQRVGETRLTRRRLHDRAGRGQIPDEFHKKLTLTGVVLTKMDGDARGGAALSICQVTGQPIKFIGNGEK